MKLPWKIFIFLILCSVSTGCTSTIVIKDNKIINPENYELASPGSGWETRTNFDTYNNSKLGLQVKIDFILINKAKNQYIFGSSALWSTDLDKIIRKKREYFTGEDTIIKYFVEDTQYLTGIKQDQIKSLNYGEMFEHSTAELEININANNEFIPVDNDRKIKLFVIGKGRRKNPFEPGYNFIVIGYLSNPDNYLDSISEFNKLLLSFKMHD
jgi:hypothetical protein